MKISKTFKKEPAKYFVVQATGSTEHCWDDEDLAERLESIKSKGIECYVYTLSLQVLSDPGSTGMYVCTPLEES